MQYFLEQGFGGLSVSQRLSIWPIFQHTPVTSTFLLLRFWMIAFCWISTWIALFNLVWEDWSLKFVHFEFIILSIEMILDSNVQKLYLEIIELFEPYLSYCNVPIEYLIFLALNQSNLLNDL